MDGRCDKGSKVKDELFGPYYTKVQSSSSRKMIHCDRQG